MRQQAIEKCLKMFIEESLWDRSPTTFRQLRAKAQILLDRSPENEDRCASVIREIMNS